MKTAFFLALIPLLLGPRLCGEESVSEPVPVVESEPAKFRDISVQEGKDLLAKEDAPIVIDVRTLEEFNKGHLDGAQVIDFKAADFREKLSKLDREKSYLVHCRSGARSQRSLAVWRELGFRKIYHLESGFLGWEREKGKVVK